MPATRMDAIEIDAFLETQDTGVLAMAEDDVSYGVPVSYAYDETGPSVYFRLGYGERSEKRRFVETTESASFVVYDDTDDGWKSVIAHGSIEECSETALEAQEIEAVQRLDIPNFTVHDEPTGELEFTIARLDVATMSGIIAG